MFEKLADMYDSVAGPPGIPWDRLIAEGHAIDREGYDAAYVQLMLEESFEFFGVIGSFSDHFKQRYRQIRASQARDAIDRMSALMRQTGSDIWDAAKSGDWTAPFKLPLDVVEDVLATAAAYAVNGAYLHFDRVVEAQMLAGVLSVEDAQKHADGVMKTFQTFVDLDKEGHLDFLKGKPVSGVGFAVTIPVMVLGAIVILGICYVLNLMYGIGPLQRKMLEWCDKLAKSGTNEDLQACISAANSMAARGNSDLGNLFSDVLRPVMTVLGIAAAIWVGSLIVPHVLRKTAS